MYLVALLAFPEVTAISAGMAGAIWGLWHVPYYLFFLPEEQMRFILDVPRPVFAALAVVVMMMWGVLFTEVYRMAKSIWPVVGLLPASLYLLLGLGLRAYRLRNVRITTGPTTQVPAGDRRADVSV